MITDNLCVLTKVMPSQLINAVECILEDVADCYIELRHCWTLPDNVVYFLLHRGLSAAPAPQAIPV